jgi:hypothetical protein
LFVGGCTEPEVIGENAKAGAIEFAKGLSGGAHQVGFPS